LHFGFIEEFFLLLACLAQIHVHISEVSKRIRETLSQREDFSLCVQTILKRNTH